MFGNDRFLPVHAEDLFGPSAHPSLDPILAPARQRYAIGAAAGS